MRRHRRQHHHRQTGDIDNRGKLGIFVGSSTAPITTRPISGSCRRRFRIVLGAWTHVVATVQGTTMTHLSGRGRRVEPADNGQEPSLDHARQSLARPLGLHASCLVDGHATSRARSSRCRSGAARSRRRPWRALVRDGDARPSATAAFTTIGRRQRAGGSRAPASGCAPRGGSRWRARRPTRSRSRRFRRRPRRRHRRRRCRRPRQPAPRRRRCRRRRPRCRRPRRRARRRAAGARADGAAESGADGAAEGFGADGIPKLGMAALRNLAPDGGRCAAIAHAVAELGANAQAVAADALAHDARANVRAYDDGVDLARRQVPRGCGHRRHSRRRHVQLRRIYRILSAGGDRPRSRTRPPEMCPQ